MDYNQVLVTCVGKEQIGKLAAEAIRDPVLFKKLSHLALTAQPPVSHKAAWAVSSAVILAPAAGTKYCPVWLSAIDEGLPEPVARELLRAMLYIAVPGRYCGHLFNSCVRVLNEHGHDIGVTYNALRLMSKCVSRYPELKQEAISLVLKHCRSRSVGVRHLAGRMLKEWGG